MTRSRTPTAVLVTAFALALAAPAAATTWKPRPFEAIVHDAAFVGVVECVTAGGIVAEHRVVETWKGAERPGETFRLRMGVDFWGPQFPVALVGQRLVIAAGADDPSVKGSTTLGGPVPLWWRRLDARHVVPVSQGHAPVDADEEALGRAFGTAPSDLDALAGAVREFAALPPAEQELRRLKRSARDVGRRLVEGHPEVGAALANIDEASTLDDAVAAVLALAEDAPPEVVRVALGIVVSGRELTARALDARAPAAFPGGDVERRRVLERLRPSPRAAPPAPSRTREAIDAARERLGEEAAVRADDVRLLAEEDPAVAAAALVRWRNPGRSWQDAHRGVVLGSTFAAFCRDDLPVHLRALLEAEDEEVRVAAAVHIAMVEPDEGVEALRRLQALPGLAGGWAALTLARRGRAESIPRALALFRGALPSGMDQVPLENLRLRTLVLLSNSAARAGVDAPPAVDPRADAAAELAAWWAEMSDRCPPFDPWLEELVAQGID